MDLFADSEGSAVSWYADSATAFGHVQCERPSGIIGRLLSYFPFPTSQATFEHERYLRGEEGKDLTPKFVKVGTMKPQHTVRHNARHTGWSL